MAFTSDILNFLTRLFCRFGGRRDGVTNFILRIKEQEKRLTLQEHDDDDEFKQRDELEPPA